MKSWPIATGVWLEGEDAVFQHNTVTHLKFTGEDVDLTHVFWDFQKLLNFFGSCITDSGYTPWEYDG